MGSKKRSGIIYPMSTADNLFFCFRLLCFITTRASRFDDLQVILRDRNHDDAPSVPRSLYLLRFLLKTCSVEEEFLDDHNRRANQT